MMAQNILCANLRIPADSSNRKLINCEQWHPLPHADTLVSWQRVGQMRASKRQAANLVFSNLLSIQMSTELFWLTLGAGGAFVISIIGMIWLVITAQMENRAAGIPAPQFSLRTLIVTIALVAAALALIIYETGQDH